MEPITSKRRFYELWNRGELGNKPRTWKTVNELKQSIFNNTVAVRYVGTGLGGAPFIPNLSVDQVTSTLKKLVKGGWSEKDFQISEQITDGYIINGEIIRTSEGLALYYSLEDKLLREAFRSSGKQAIGLKASMILQHLLWPSDYEALMEINELYPDHAIEFSGFDRPVGVIRGRRVIIWEVRRY